MYIHACVRACVHIISVGETLAGAKLARVFLLVTERLLLQMMIMIR